MTQPSWYGPTGPYAVNGSTRMNFGAIRTSVVAGSGDETNFNYFACFAKNGSSSSTNNFTGRFRIQGNGNVYTSAGYTWNSYDFAEYYESFDGKQIPVGTTVVAVDPDEYDMVIQNPDGTPFDFDKINLTLTDMTGALDCINYYNRRAFVRASTGSDDPKKIIGVVRPKGEDLASVVGNSQWNEWSNKYMRDDFGRKIKEPVFYVKWTEHGVKYCYRYDAIPSYIKVPAHAIRTYYNEKGEMYTRYKENIFYDPSVEYEPRDAREEWVIVGMVGQVEVKNDQPVHPEWKKISKISDTVSMYLIK